MGQDLEAGKPCSFEDHRLSNKGRRGLCLLGAHCTRQAWMAGQTGTHLDGTSPLGGRRKHRRKETSLSGQHPPTPCPPRKPQLPTAHPGLNRWHVGSHPNYCWGLSAHKEDRGQQRPTQVGQVKAIHRFHLAAAGGCWNLHPEGGVGCCPHDFSGSSGRCSINARRWHHLQRFPNLGPQNPPWS